MIRLSFILQLITLWFVMLIFIQTDTPTSNDLVMLMGSFAEVPLIVIPIIIVIILVKIFK